LIFLATSINYIDRQSISLLFPVMSRPSELNLTPLQYSRIAAALLIAYMCSQSLSGKFFDRFGARVGFSVSILIWSFASMGHALIVGFCELRGVFVPAWIWTSGKLAGLGEGDRGMVSGTGAGVRYGGL
jgi:ACS family hexuronate transporter-like MFS transporter